MAVQDSPSHVNVMVTNTDKGSADAVFDVLSAVFPSSGVTYSPQPRRPGAAPPSAPTVWSMTVDVSRHGRSAKATYLSHPVRLSLQGSDPPLAEVADALRASFEVKDEQSIAGDQERECRLLLDSRSDAPSR